FAGFRIHAHLVTFVHEGRHLHDETRLEPGRLHLRAGRGAFDPRHGLLDNQVDGLRQLDPDRLGAVELDANGRVGDEIVLRIPPDSVAPPSNLPDILGRRALSSGRLAALGATPDFHHGLPAPINRVTMPHVAFTRWDPLRDLLALHEQLGQLVGSDAPGWTPP